MWNYDYYPLVFLPLYPLKFASCCWRKMSWLWGLHDHVLGGKANGFSGSATFRRRPLVVPRNIEIRFEQKLLFCLIAALSINHRPLPKPWKTRNEGGWFFQLSGNKKKKYEKNPSYVWMRSVQFTKWNCVSDRCIDAKAMYSAVIIVVLFSCVVCVTEQFITLYRGIYIYLYTTDKPPPPTALSRIANKWFIGLLFCRWCRTFAALYLLPCVFLFPFPPPTKTRFDRFARFEVC